VTGGAGATRVRPVTHTLSEHDSKRLLARYGVPFLSELAVADPDEAVAAADQVGYPVVAKLNGDTIAHKTERGLVRLNLTDQASVHRAARELLDAATPADGEVQVLVAPFVRGNRELICGLADDPQFGMTVLLGVGGVLAEALGDVALRLVPLTAVDAAEMLDDLRTQDLLGAFRGEPPVDREAVADVLLALSAAAEAEPDLRSVDLNPLIIVDGRPVAVDALVEVAG
jgi:acetate---CoA ligase (ADP-forming) subunit beta